VIGPVQPNWRRKAAADPPPWPPPMMTICSAVPLTLSNLPLLGDYQSENDMRVKFFLWPVSLSFFDP
jgi:hypothetical protein